MKYRQIHLDFHTSPILPDVGKEFEPNEFASTLVNAHVNSINIFAKCHHGMCYYPTKVGKMHPSLPFDLLGSMIDVLHKNNIRCPVYFPLGWEEDAAEHTEWLEVGKDGISGHKLPFDSSNNSWKKLCLNNPEYKKYIKEQLKELLENYDVDGFWFDIIFQQKCLCKECISEIKGMGLDPENEEDVLRHDEYVLKKLQNELNTFIFSYKRDISIFYNSPWAPDGGYSGPIAEERAALQTHMEIESLPSGKWGYNHFPLSVNFFNRNNAETTGMTGKFHLSWGDHGSLKNDEALEYECFRMIANGCACSIGDQMHPKGSMNTTAYHHIGKIFGEIEKVEPFCFDSKKFAEIGVVVSSDYLNPDALSDEGAMRMLMELHHPFDFISIRDELSRYRLIILPDNVKIDDSFSQKLKEYIQNSGKVISTYKSTDSVSLGVAATGDYDYCPAYIVVDDTIPAIEPLEYVCYERGAFAETALPVKAFIGDPYHNRSYDCFSSHMHFPFEKKSDYPAICLSESIGYCAFPLFRDYIKNGNRIFRELIRYLIDSLLPDPFIETNAPPWVELTVRMQPGRIIIHVLCYIAEHKTKTIDTVDSRMMLCNLSIKLRQKEKISRIFCVRSGYESEDYSAYGDSIEFTIPEINGYDVIIAEYQT